MAEALDVETTHNLRVQSCREEKKTVRAVTLGQFCWRSEAG
jgi:hypothetical protein